MKNNKDIEQIFQKKLKDFEASPPSESWDYISEKLQEKKERKRILPLFWWSAIAVSSAAVIIFGFFLMRNDEVVLPNKQHQITTTKTTNTVENKELSSSNKLSESPATISTYTKGCQKTTNKEVIKKEEIQSNIHHKNSIQNHMSDIFPNLAKAKISTSQTQNTEQQIDYVKKDENPIAQNKNLITDTKENSSSSVVNPPNFETKKTNDSITNLLSQNKQDQIDLLNNPEEKKVELEKSRKENRFSVSPFVAPLFVFSDGNSPIGTEFNTAKTVQTNLGYGLNASYALTEKISLRSGLHHIQLNNNAQDVVFSRSTSATTAEINTLSNVATTQNIGSITILSSISNFQNYDTSSASFSDYNFENGILQQELSFLEVPLEVSYPIFSRRLKINAITGFSTYFLNRNKIYLVTSDSNLEIGKLNNINKLHYSGNLGFDIQYTLKKKLIFFVEPVFKYQINTYQSGTTDTQPYFIGVYTGFVYKF